MSDLRRSIKTMLLGMESLLSASIVYRKPACVFLETTDGDCRWMTWINI